MDNPGTSSYKFTPLTKLLRNREIGCSKKTNRGGQQFVTDYEILRSLYCSKNSYLEVVYCEKVFRSISPSFCYGRLFTNNYKKWFNLHTKPSSPPMLMTENVFKTSATGFQSQIIFELEPIKIVDAISIHSIGSESYIYLLSKRGWLYEIDLVTAVLKNAICIPTKQYADMLYDWSDTPKIDLNEKPDLNKDRSAMPRYRYIYITENRQAESIIVKSARQPNPSTNQNSTAFCVLKQNPLRIHCHFIVNIFTPKLNPPLTCDIDSDMFIIAKKAGSKVSFYSLNDIIKEYNLNQTIVINQKVKIHVGCNLRPKKGCVGDFEVGIPYTMNDVFIPAFPKTMFKNIPCLFEAPAARFSLQIGGVPYHYLVPTNKHGTSWSLKNLASRKDISGKKLHISQRWDSSQWDGVSVHSDDSGRFIKQNNSYVEVFQLEYTNNNDKEVENQRLTSCYKINIKPKPPKKSLNILNLNENLEGIPHSISSHGRVIHSPRPFFSYNPDTQSVCEMSYTLISVVYDRDLDVLGLLYYRPTGHYQEGWENKEGSSELVVSIHDNFSGSHLKTFILENGVSPCDRDTLSLTIRQEMIVFTRFQPVDFKMEYKILTLNRNS